MNEIKYVEDSNGNKCYVDYFGSVEDAQKALDSLEDCKNCINCSRCSDCSRCSGCSNCSRCSGCSGCSRCSGCSDLINVHDGITPSSFVPKIENIDKVVYEACSQPNALNMNDWHTCDTTHCRAGWVVHLAGKAGKELELFHNTALAAQLIYAESGSPINPCRLFDDNVDAMADMKARAENAN